MKRSTPSLTMLTGKPSSSHPGHELREARIQLDAIQHRIEVILRAADQRDLAGHAVGARELARQPGVLQHRPLAVGQPLQDQIGGVLTRNRAVEIADDAH